MGERWELNNNNEEREMRGFINNIAPGRRINEHDIDGKLEARADEVVLTFLPKSQKLICTWEEEAVTEIGYRYTKFIEDDQIIMGGKRDVALKTRRREH